MPSTTCVNGSCLCGALAFAVALPTKWCAHCHCTRCRKSHGAGYVTWAGYDEAQVTWLRGREQLKWHQSSPGAKRGFCRRCGSSLFFRSDRWAGELHVALGCLDGPIDIPPGANVDFEQHVDWMPVDRSLKTLKL